MSFEYVLELATLALGVSSVALSCRWFVHFVKSEKGIGRAVSYMAFGEAVMSGMTCVFAGLSLLDMINAIPHTAQSFMRLFMFSIAMASTVHLAYQVKEIEDKV